jgi:hypothetical protein
MPKPFPLELSVSRVIDAPPETAYELISDASSPCPEASE